MNETDHELLCRLCLRNSCLCSDIYVSQSSRGNPIYEVINYVYDLEISMDDGLPKYVCQQCLGIVKEFENYKRNAHKTRRELMMFRERNNMYVKVEEEDSSDNTNGQSVSDGHIDKPQEVQKRKMESCDDLTSPEMSGWLMDANHENHMEYANSRAIKQEPEEDEHWRYEESNCSSIDSRGLIHPSRVTPGTNHLGGAGVTTTHPDETPESPVVIKTESPDLEQYCPDNFSSHGSIDRKYLENQYVDDSNSGCITRGDSGALPQRSFGRENHPGEGLGTSAAHQYHCNTCGYVSPDQWHWRTHQCPAIGENAFSCSHCDYRTSTSANLSAHMSRHSGLKRYQCGLCDFSAADRTHLRTHAYKHSGQRPFKCGLCEYSTIDRTYLRNHMYKHSGLKPYKCQLCDYRAAARSQLRPHMFTHTGEKRFECGLCEYRTAVKSNLRTHMFTHTGERPFECNWCSYKCSNSSALKAHVRTHTGEKPFKCQWCDYSATTRSCFKKHVEKHQGEVAQGSW